MSDGKFNKVLDGFLGDDGISLEALQAALEKQVMPFLADWWRSEYPIPRDNEIASVRKAISTRAGSDAADIAYSEIPSLLSVLAESMRFNRRNFVNIHPSPYLPAVLANLVVSIQNPNNIVEEVSKSTSALERDCISWIATELLGLDCSKSWGNIVSGGTVANMTALLVARDYAYDKLSRPRISRIGARGVIGQSPGVVLGSNGSHYSLEKALWFLGLGHENLVRVPVCWDEMVERGNYKDARFIDGIRRQPWRSLLKEALRIDRETGRNELRAFYSGEQFPFGLQPLGSMLLKTLYSCFEFSVPLIACVLTLGTTDTGTIERMNNFAIEELRNEDIFIHGDAASGGFAFLSENVRPKLVGVGKLDSYTVDGHKMGFVPYPCGAIVFKDSGFMQQIYHEAPYLGPLAPTLEGSRPGGSSAALWVMIKTLGADGYRFLVNRLLSFTKHLAAVLASSGQFQILHVIDLNAIAISPIPRPGETRHDINQLVRRVRNRMVQDGSFLVNLDKHLSGIKVNNFNDINDGSTPIDIEAIRIVVTNPLVEQNEADELVSELVNFLDEERKKSRSKSGPT